MRRLGLASRYALGLARLRPRDVLVGSFPRSGSTYLRFLTAYAVAGEHAPALDFAALNRRMPELGADALADPAPLAGAPRVVKTHRPWTPLFGRPRAVWLVRAPLDALASYHRYWAARGDAGRLADAGAFLRDRRRGLPRWIRHTRSWAPRAAHTVRYADLQRDPAGTLRAWLDVLGVPASDAAVASAVARARAARVRELPVTGSDTLAPDFAFARDAERGGGLRHFPAGDVAWAVGALRAAGLGTWADEIASPPAPSR